MQKKRSLTHRNPYPSSSPLPPYLPVSTDRLDSVLVITTNIVVNTQAISTYENMMDKLIVDSTWSEIMIFS